MVNEFDLEMRKMSKTIDKIIRKYGLYLSNDQVNDFKKVKDMLFKNFGVDK